jgi:superkiller protein 3
MEPEGKLVVREISGGGNPPEGVPWDGRNYAGDLVPQGPYVLSPETTDLEGRTTKGGPTTVTTRWIPCLGPKENDAECMIQEGVPYLKQGNNAAALGRFLKALEADPNNGQAQAYAGEAYYALGKKKEALAAYRRAVRLNSRYTGLKDWVDKYGEILSKAGPASPLKPPKQVSNPRPRITPPVSPAAGLSMAMVRESMRLMDSENYLQALGGLLKAVEVDPANGRAYYLLGDCYYKLGKSGEAAEAYRHAETLESR